ncbi:MAG: hypoxanthine phosphoribosyltransferase [Acidimicrobiia bacterium]|nr:MAG: hypoxanthine phosphoribosyltransferase [Acidimicrobiia bacterium]
MDLEPRFTSEEIADAVSRVAAEISANHQTETPLMVGILTGSFVFLADLVREMTIPVEIDFIRARSYGKGTESSGAVEITKDIEHDITGRTVILVEDILDTGLTLRFVRDRIRAGNPSAIETCALLVREGATPSDYMGLWIPPGFVVGYGIDYAEQYRELPDIRAVPGT